MPGEPAYVTSLEEIAWGLALIAITIVMHGLGTTWAILATEPSADPTRPDRLGLGLVHIIGLALLLVALHLLEVLVWAGFFSWQGCFSTMSLSYYFALLDYTTLGSDFNLPSRWRLLEGMIAICGLLTFAWTTSVLMGVIQQIQDRRVRRRQLDRGASDR
jgi:voltage-gated potassium channel